MNLVDGLKKVLEADNLSTRKIIEKLSKGLPSTPSTEDLIGPLVDRLKEYSPLVEKSAKQIGWKFALNNSTILVDYYKIAYERFSELIPTVAGLYDYKKEDIDASIYWIPEHFGEIATVDDTIGEWHFSVSYKDVYLFGLVVTPIFEEKTVAIISEEVEESFDASFFGYEANPYVDLNSYDELIKFLNTYFEHADIKGTHSNEIERKTNKNLHF